MSTKKILALSSSRCGNENYLETATGFIKQFLGEVPVKIAFVPFALVSKNYDEYFNNVKTALKDLPFQLILVTENNAAEIIADCDGIMVGGGNTFKLLHDIYNLNILTAIRMKVNAGVPYIGWSAGSNILAPTIGTTNDMPVVEPKSFEALQIFPFQLNPHYYNQKPEGFNGETRDQRLTEYVEMNPGKKIIGLPEGTGLQLTGQKLELVGKQPATLFYKEKDEVITTEIKPGDDLSFLLK